MGSVASRFSHGVRDAVRACSGKRRRRRRRDKDEDEARLSTYESEPLDRGGTWAAMSGECGHERAVSVSRTGSRTSSLARLHDGKVDAAVPCGRLASVSPRPGHRGSPRPPGSLHHHHHLHYQQQQQDPHPGVSYQAVPACASCNSTGISASLSPCCCRRPRPWLVDQGSQTTTGCTRGQELTGGTASSEDIPCSAEPVLSKEYIVRTYSIQNATPSPSPSTQSKFPSPEGEDTPSSTRTRLPHVPEWTPSPPSTLERASSSSGCERKSEGPLGALEQRQEDVLKRLEQMQATVTELALRYKVTESAVASSSSSSSTTAITSVSSGVGLPKCLGEPGRILDLVISADPSSLPLSLVVLSERLSRQFPTLLSTFVHSSVVASEVPDKLQQLLRSNGGRSRADCQIAVTLVWKKVSHGPLLVVDPVHQTAIHGEANVARYLWGLLTAGSSNLDPAQVTLEDELVDQAQLQILDGNNKERAAAVRKLNAMLGKQQVWLMGGNAPSLADIVCWSAVHQTDLAQGASPNIQRWLAGCSKHSDFVTAQNLLAVLGS